ncbi:hypothetical protein Enr13x_40480 [Stieleria neptunia]|uniref:Uncharacterized protein n=1 Tax=Stieleria neptunia TaxID=2527979 RepID=A0A518HTM4_9BACT|nr:hypothetical protein [Stieleria neptunia]QDV44186.1 hypothetical protein Enr13x_40480 [Stieleria neptunia]
MRLPVILVQNPPASAAGLAESLVGNLIGRAGLDLTLVGRFDSLAGDSTDRMTLDGITVPSAILDWRSESEMMEVLATIEFHGSRCPHQLDPGGPFAPGKSSRRLFLFDLTKHQDVHTIVAELDRLRASLSVKTVSLGGLGSVGSATVKPAANRDTGNRDTGNRDTGNRDTGNRDDEATVRPVPVTAVPRQPTPVAPASPRSDENLDSLIDQLDNLDV